MKKILSIIIIIAFVTLLNVSGFAYTASDNLELRLLEADDDIRPLREDLNYNFELVDDIFDDVTTTEFNYLDGVTSAIQTQLNAKQTLDAQLTDIAGLTPTDSYFIVGDGTNFITESGATARTSLGIDLTLYYLKTAIDTQGEVETIWGTTLCTDSELTTALTDYYLKTAIDTQGEVETIWGVSLLNDITGESIGNLSNVDLTDLANNKILKYNSTTSKFECETESGGGAGTYLELTDTPAAYDNGKYAKSTADGVVWDDPAGAGDMLKATYDTDVDGDVDVAAGGTEKSLWTLYCIPYLSGTTAFGEIPIGTAGQVLKVAAGATDYEWATLSYLANVVEDTTPELGGEMDAGAHTIGFTQQVATGDGTTTIDWKLGNKFKFTFGAFNETFTFTAPSNPCSLILLLVQDATGSRTATWPATVKWPGGTAPTLTTTANSVDAVGLYYDGTNYYCTSSLDLK